MDIKKLPAIPPGGGWRAHGRATALSRSGAGYRYLHTAIDDHSRLAYSEDLNDEQGATAAAFWSRAVAWFATWGVTCERVLTDHTTCRLRSGLLFEGLAIRISSRQTQPRPEQKILTRDRVTADWARIDEFGARALAL